MFTGPGCLIVLDSLGTPVETFYGSLINGPWDMTAFDGEHENYAGEIGLSANPKLKARIENADLVMLVGGRMSEAAAQGYTLFDIPAPRQQLVHIHADPHEIGLGARQQPQRGAHIVGGGGQRLVQFVRQRCRHLPHRAHP